MRTFVTGTAALALLAESAKDAGGQEPRSPRADSAFVRAQQLANNGSTAAGRALVDSVLRASREGSATYIDALFFRAGLAPSAGESRQDYLRIVVEYTLSHRAEDALLRLAQLEFAAGDRPAARRHLERLALEHPSGGSRAQGAYWLGRVLLEDGATPAACAAFDTARARATASDVELTNQVSYYSRPCAAVREAVREAVQDSIRADSVAKADAARRDSVEAAEAAARAAKSIRRPTATTRNTAPRTWSVQVAAYSTKAEGDRFAARLAARGYEARVTAVKPHRVRIGRFASRAEAVALAAKLKEEKTNAIVVEAERP